MAGNESGRFDWEKAMLVQASHLSTAEKTVRDQFVDQYMLDRDAHGACLRIGYTGPLAVQKAFEFMDEPYVRQRIAHLEFMEEEDPKGALCRKRKIIEASLMREAHRFTSDKSHSSRVKALVALAGIYDMNAPIRTKSEVTHRGGVMLIPAVASVDDWEKAAVSSQEKLIADARH